MQCHGHFHARKMGPLLRQTLWLEDMAVDTWVPSSCGPVVMPRLQGLCTPPAWHTCTSLACGWALATGRHTITTSVWLTGATAVTHFSHFCPAFKGGTNGRGMVSKSTRNGRPPSPPRAFVRTAASLISSGVAAHHILESGPSHDLYNTTRRKGCKDLAQSAWKRRNGRIVSPRARAVLRLMTSSPGIGCSTGRSAALALFRSLST